MDRRLCRILVGALVLCLILSSGCIVPERKPATTSGSPAGTSGTSGTPGGAGGSVTTQPTEDTRYLSPVTPYPTATSEPGPQGRVLPENTTSPESYIEIFNQTYRFMGNTEAKAYTLSSPPLVINLHIVPKMITDRIGYYDRYTTREFKEETVTKPSPDAVFAITVRDKDTGSVVLTEGYGKTYGYDTTKELILRSQGTYQFDFSGFDTNVTVSMKIRQ